MDEFDNNVIKIWVIVYDGDANRVYSFTDFEKVVAAICGSIRCFFGDPDAETFDIVCDQIANKMRQSAEAACIPLQFTSFRDDAESIWKAVIYNWELSKTNTIHKLLADCYDAVDDHGLQDRISSLFSPSVR